MCALHHGECFLPDILNELHLIGGLKSWYMADGAFNTLAVNNDNEWL